MLRQICFSACISLSSISLVQNFLFGFSRHSFYNRWHNLRPFLPWNSHFIPSDGVGPQRAASTSSGCARTGSRQRGTGRRGTANSRTGCRAIKPAFLIRLLRRRRIRHRQPGRGALRARPANSLTSRRKWPVPMTKNKCTPLPPLTANRRDDLRDYFCIFNPAAS